MWAPLSSAMTACRSSRLLAETRISSPVIWVLTPLGPSSRTILPIFLATSWLRPSLSVATRRYSLPDGCGSRSPVSSAFSEIPRLISLVWNTSRTAMTRSAEFAVMTTDSPLQAIEAPTFLKSYRCAISLAAWFSALSTSCRSTLLTTSNDDSLAMTPPVLCSGAAAPSGGPVGAGSSDPWMCCYPSIRTARGSSRGTRGRRTAGYPSGQRGLTVNQLATPTGVRIPHPPHARGVLARGRPVVVPGGTEPSGDGLGGGSPRPRVAPHAAIRPPREGHGGVTDAAD